MFKFILELAQMKKKKNDSIKYRRSSSVMNPFLGCQKKLDELNSDSVEWFLKSYYSIQFRGNSEIMTNIKSTSNKTTNTKYSLLTFLPLSLFHQFSDFQNFFYLAVALSQLFPLLRIGPIFTYIVPLMFVILMSMLREAIDELHRWYLDRRRDQEKCVLLQYIDCINEIRGNLCDIDPVAGFVGSRGVVHAVKVPRADLKPGDLLYILPNTRIPADTILLLVDSINHPDECYLRTDELDGEKGWKLRRPLLSRNEFDVTTLIEELRFILDYEKPTPSIHQFNGRMRNADGTMKSLSIDNFLPADSILMTGPGIGVIAYTGEDTRVAISRSVPTEKISNIDIRLNYMSKLLFVVLMGISLLLTIAQNGIISSYELLFVPAWWISTSIHFTRFFLLLSSILPISLRVNLDFAKIVYSILISRDQRMEERASLRSSNIVENLGEVDIILSDKTGTLTNNELTLRQIIVNASSHKMTPSVDLPKNSKSFDMPPVGDTFIDPPPRLTVLIAMLMCHRCRPLSLSKNEKIPKDFNTATSPKYDGGSPDELAFLEALYSLDLKVLSNGGSSVSLRIPASRLFASKHDYIDLHFKRLLDLPFSTKFRLMISVVRLYRIESLTGDDIDVPEDVPVMILAKGPDNEILPRCLEDDWGPTEVEKLAKKGLRTMTFAYKLVAFNDWKPFIERNQVLESRPHTLLDQLLNEHGKWSVLSCSGIEDCLQEKCPETISQLYEANLKVWMLTGDKSGTSICVARSAGIITPRTHIIEITDEIKNHHDLTKLFKSTFCTTKPNDCALILDSKTLNRVVDMKIHLNTLTSLRTIILSRLSPLEKATIVKAIKSARDINGYKKYTVLAIGDGGNDVPMLMEADVGIGIEGKEGSQASLSADVSIAKFEHLIPLLLCHGRNTRQRTIKLTSFIIHRGLIFAFIQALYCALFAYVPLPIYQGWLCVGYATVFTMFPVFCLILGSNTKSETNIHYAKLYKERINETLNAPMLHQWLVVSLFQAFVIISLALMEFDSNMTHLGCLLTIVSNNNIS